MTELSRVVWSEGMLMCPQHLQQQDLFFEGTLAQRLAAATPYAWGVVSVTIYTIIPARLFAGFPIPFVGGGGDSYNPFTNTVSIYSGSRPIALHVETSGGPAARTALTICCA